MTTQRLDKILARELNITRSQTKDLIKQKRVALNGEVVKKQDIKCCDDDVIEVDGKRLAVNEYVYIMMNKPKGVISASEGNGEQTVVDILPDEMKRKNLFPAGRLDKDTTGFVLITDDGDFAHQILSPKNHIDKTYIATLDKPFDNTVVEAFASGVVLNGEKLLEADLEAVDGDFCKARVVLRQGLYHQVKRMFKKYGITVVELDRIAMGKLLLDSNLQSGECRYITSEELNLIKS